MRKLTNLTASSVKKIFPNALSPVGVLLAPFIPNSVLSHYRDGKMTLAMLKNNEAIFDDLLAELNKRMKEESLKIIQQDNPFDAIQIQNQIDLTERYTRYISILRKSLKYIELTDSDKKEESSTSNTSPSWFDMFRDIAMRMNEEWRENLLARCVAIEDNFPGSISLKTLWNIGLLETQIFHSFALFLDSSIDLDGYPVILLNRDDLTLRVESSDGCYHGILIYLISGLIDNGLIQYGEFELPSDEPIQVVGKECSSLLENLEQKEGRTTLIRLEGYSCTDLGLDLYRLYDPVYNKISSLNFQALADMLEESEGVAIKNT